MGILESSREMRDAVKILIEKSDLIEIREDGQWYLKKEEKDG